MSATLTISPRNFLRNQLHQSRVVRSSSTSRNTALMPQLRQRDEPHHGEGLRLALLQRLLLRLVPSVAQGRPAQLPAARLIVHLVTPLAVDLHVRHPLVVCRNHGTRVAASTRRGHAKQGAWIRPSIQRTSMGEKLSSQDWHKNSFGRRVMKYGLLLEPQIHVLEQPRKALAPHVAAAHSFQAHQDIQCGCRGS